VGTPMPCYCFGTYVCKSGYYDGVYYTHCISSNPGCTSWQTWYDAISDECGQMTYGGFMGSSIDTWPCSQAKPSVGTAFVSLAEPRVDNAAWGHVKLCYKQ
jgi:hypothetical protein